ncbi:MAG: hypothetical protein M1318_02315 [Firmicutes bacterium]|nr:hypothetical protein [Bacillota bacterium]
MGMLSDYITKAMARVTVDQLPDGRFFSTIPGYMGVLADGATAAEAVAEAQAMLEEWLVRIIYDHLPIPPLDGVGIVYPQPPEASSAGGFPL